MLLNYINSIKMNILPDGTAIGDGIATSLNRLKEGKAKSRSIILLTDGSNNTGVVAPVMATDVAKELGVRIYTVGIGTNGMAPTPVMGMFGNIEYEPQKVVIDEGTLREIADARVASIFVLPTIRSLATCLPKSTGSKKQGWTCAIFLIPKTITCSSPG